MIWQDFVMLQLGLLALGLGAVLGMRSWQMRRQVALLTEQFGQAPAIPPAEAESATPAPTEAAAPTDTESPDSSPESVSAAETEQPPEAAANEAKEETQPAAAPDMEPEPTEIDEQTDSSPASAEPSVQAADDSFSDLNDLLPTPEPEPKPEAKSDEQDEGGLRALVTKFASENRELMEQVQLLQNENAELKAAAQTAPAPSEPTPAGEVDSIAEPEAEPETESEDELAAEAENPEEPADA